MWWQVSCHQPRYVLWKKKNKHCQTCLECVGAWQSVPSSGFLERALAQTCLLAWYQVRFLEIFLGILVYGKGAPWYGTSAQPKSHFTYSSPRCAPRSGGTKQLSLELFLGILRGPKEGRGCPWCGCRKLLAGKGFSRKFRAPENYSQISRDRQRYSCQAFGTFRHFPFVWLEKCCAAN